MTSCFIVPCYGPTETLLKVLQTLVQSTSSPILVVDDGSPEKSIFKDPLFSHSHITLLTHAVNLGKGAALKTAFNYALTHFPDLTGCITLDADGQHAIADVMTVASFMQQQTGLVLGVRNFNFNDKTIPIKSRIGNLLTRSILKLITGARLTDTQTGLRGLSANLMKECLSITANRYEFEMEMLFRAQELNVPIRETAISTIYIDDNKGSHFNPLLDSLKIYFVIFRYFLSSLLSCVLDYALFSLFVIGLSLSAGVSFVFARVLAGVFNYQINKRIVFNVKTERKHSGARYIALVLLNMYIGYVVLGYLDVRGSDAFLAKIGVEVVLFICNFFLQKEWVFRKIAPLNQT